MLKALVVGFGLAAAHAAHAVETYDCKTNLLEGKRTIFSKQFAVDSESAKSWDYTLRYHGQKHMVDCGINDSVPKDFVCGLSAWNDKAKTWSTEARAATEVGAPALILLHGDGFDINCHLRKASEANPTF